MAQVREQFPPPPGGQPARLLGEDYRFSPGRLPVTAAFRLEHDAIDLLEQPLALSRVYHLRDDGDVGLAIELRLCWHGPADAIESLYRFTESFQRPLPERVVRVSDEGLGDLGFAWSWDDPLGPEVVAFVRANVLVTVRAPDGAGVAERVARAIDGELRGLRTIERYDDATGGVFDAIPGEREGASIPVARGGRATLARQPATERWFFVTSRGSANRDPDTPDVWYYRAGMEPGDAEVRLFRADEGLLPVTERLTVRVR